jgi:hypothetical protein
MDVWPDAAMTAGVDRLMKTHRKRDFTAFSFIPSSAEDASIPVED